MAYNTKPIKRDVNSKPIPQYYNPVEDEYQVVHGRNGAQAVEVFDSTGTAIDVSQNSLRVIQTLPPSQRLGNQLLCSGDGLTVAKSGGTADSYVVDVRYFSRKTVLIEVSGAPVTAKLYVSYDEDVATYKYIPVDSPSYEWSLAVGKHAIVIPPDLQCNYMMFTFTNNNTETDAIIKGYWQLKEV